MGVPSGGDNAIEDDWRKILHSRPARDEKTGVYDPRNTLNDLSGKQWKFSTRSVITKQYPPDLQFQLRSKHGGQKPPRLCADLIETFTKKGALVLDPFAGVGGTLLGASLCQRRAIGIEINPRWAKIYKEVCALEHIEEQEIVVGDSKKALLDTRKFATGSVDFILTDVPYWKMHKVEQTRAKSYKRSRLSEFDDEPAKTKEGWLRDMWAVFEQCQRILKRGRYLVIFIGDMYRGKEYHMLHADLARAVSNKVVDGSKLILKANLIWYDVSKSLHVFGYPKVFIPSLTHQNILVLRKE